MLMPNPMLYCIHMNPCDHGFVVANIILNWGECEIFQPLIKKAFYETRPHRLFLLKAQRGERLSLKS